MGAADYPSVVSSTYTTSGDLDSVQTAYDRRAFFALRPELYFDMIADVKSEPGTKGLAVKFTLFDDLSITTAPLNESVDMGASALGDSQVEVVLDEYGKSVITTAKVRQGSFLQVDTDAANIVGQNAGMTLDQLAVNALVLGTNVKYAGNATARNTVGPDDLLTSAKVRRVVAEMRGDNVATFNGVYHGYLHPDVSVDLREETDAAGRREPHNNVNTEHIYNAIVGLYEGVQWIEAARAPVLADAGSSTTLTDVYQTLVVGRQGLAKAYSSSESGPYPKVILSPITDKAMRFHPITWYWLGGYKIFRQAVVWRIESSASGGANT